jgi:hypothetical protein
MPVHKPFRMRILKSTKILKTERRGYAQHCGGKDLDIPVDQFPPLGSIVGHS